MTSSVSNLAQAMTGQEPAKNTDIPIDHLDYGYVNKCSNGKELEKILKTLRFVGRVRVLVVYSNEYFRVCIVNPRNTVLVGRGLGNTHVRLLFAEPGPLQGSQQFKRLVLHIKIKGAG